MKRTRIVMGLVTGGALLAGGVSCNTSKPLAQEEIVATLSGANEVPPRQTTGSGSFSATVGSTALTFKLEVSNLTNVTAAHIHSGPAGTNGNVVVDLFTGPTVASTGRDFTLARGTIAQAQIKATTLTFAQLLDGLRTGQFYVNVHTTTFPGGEVRGQTSTVTR